VGTTQQLNRYAKLVYNYSRRDKNLWEVWIYEY
jgi:hypothetical protein